MKIFSSKSPLLLGALIVVALLIAGCGGSDSKTASQSPAEAMKSALAKTASIESGKATLSGSVSLGSVPGSFELTGDSQWDMNADGGAALELTIDLNVAGTKQSIGFISVGGKNYITTNDRAIEQKDSSIEPKQVQDFINGLSKYLTNVKSTTENTYTANVDVKKMIADNKDSSGDLSKLSIPGLGSGDDLAKTLGNATVTVTVDSQGYAQQMDIDLPIKSGNSEGGLRLKIALTDINGSVSISKPKNIVSAGELGGLGSALSGR